MPGPGLFRLREVGTVPAFFISCSWGKRVRDTAVVETVRRLVEPLCSELGLELVAVQFRREAGGQVLRIVIFRPEGVTVDDCARVSRELGYILDVEDCIDQAYTLEVTSPGLDWPLVTERDFTRYQGKRVDVAWVAGEESRMARGTILGAGDGRVDLQLDQGGRTSVPLDQITRARLVVEF